MVMVLDSDLLKSSSSTMAMAVSKEPHSTKNEREHESVTSSHFSPESDQHSVGPHPAFYTAYCISLLDPVKANVDARAGYGLH